MKIIRYRFIPFLLYFICCFNSINAQIPAANFITGKLPNGMTYYLLHNQKPDGRASFYLAQRVGSVLEEENQRGLAHFLEHMAFNGTKNFPDNTMVSELEKKGIRMGEHINALTEYDRTTYKLDNIPVNRQGLIDTMLLVLHDWSAFLTLADSSINMERGVVHEEWRTRSTGQLRVLENNILPVIYKGSPYATRIPIGSMDVVDHFKPEILREFYEKWHRPDLQAVVIAGDIDLKKTEERLKQIFADIPPRAHPVPLPVYSIPDNEKPVVATATDEELSGIEMNIYWKVREQNAVRFDQLYQALGNMITGRFYKLKQQNQGLREISSYIAAYTSFLYVPGVQSLDLRLFPADTVPAISVLSAGMREIERIRRFGFTKEELEVYKRNELQLEKMNAMQKSAKTSDIYCAELGKSFFNQVPFDLGGKDKLHENFVRELKLDSLNLHIKDMLTDDNMVFIITGQKKAGLVLPEEKDIYQVLEKIKSEKLQPFVYLAEKTYVLPAIKTPPGKVVSTMQKPYGFTQWTLSNGVKVQYKEIKGKEEGVTLYGYGSGGIYAIPLSELPSALAMKNAVRLLQKHISDPNGRVILDLNVGDYDQTIAGNSTVSELETLFKLTNLKMTSVNSDSTDFNVWMKRQLTLKRKHTEPKEIFGDTLNVIMAGNNPRKKTSLEDPELLKKVSFKRVTELFRGRFANASDFTFIISGTAPTDHVKALAVQYLGGLPGKGEASVNPAAIPSWPVANITKHLNVFMKTPQTTVTIGYIGPLEMSVRNQMLLQSLTEILKIVYDEHMREKMAATYGVSVSGDTFKSPSEGFILQMNFDTDPAKKQQMLDVVGQQIEKIKEQGPDPDVLAKVKVGLIKQFQSWNSEKNATWWATQAYLLEVFGLDNRVDYQEMVNKLGTETIRDFARSLFNSAKKIEVVMDPG